MIESNYALIQPGTVIGFRHRVSSFPMREPNHKTYTVIPNNPDKPHDVRRFRLTCNTVFQINRQTWEDCGGYIVSGAKDEGELHQEQKQRLTEEAHMEELFERAYHLVKKIGVEPGKRSLARYLIEKELQSVYKSVTAPVAQPAPVSEEETITSRRLKALIDNEWKVKRYMPSKATKHHPYVVIRLGAFVGFGDTPEAALDDAILGKDVVKVAC